MCYSLLNHFYWSVYLKYILSGSAVLSFNIEHNTACDYTLVATFIIPERWESKIISENLVNRLKMVTKIV